MLRIVFSGEELRRAVQSLLFLVLALCSFGNVYSDSAELLQLKKKVESTYYTFDSGRLESVLKEILCAEAKSPKLWYLYYYEGIIRIQLGKIYYVPNSDIAFNHFDKSVDCLQHAKDMNDTPELATLLSCANGKKSSLSPIKAIYYGIKAKNYIYEASSKKYNNSKIYLIAATHLMHTPENFGGDKAKARVYLNKCLELNKLEEKDPYIVEWAENAEVYAYLAQLEILLQNANAAKKYMKKALDIVPDYGFVKFDLQNQLNKLK